MPPDPTTIAATLPLDSLPNRTTSAAGPVYVPGYVIHGELGRGGMGVVYHATQTKLNRPVALKMVLSGEHADPQELQRFLAEAEAVAAVRHTHVVQVYEFGEAGGRPYFAMEFLAGGGLSDKLAAGPMSPAAAVDLVRRLAEGVHAAHECGIVHRDLKPQNVMFDAAGTPKVTDFGLAKRGDQGLTQTGAILGTPAYMAPEQAAGRAKFAGPAVDVYALGAILFACLTGRPPFVSPDIVALITQVAEDDPPTVREFAPHVSRDIEAVCRKCLAKTADGRYATAAELAEDLRRVAEGERPSASHGSLFGGFRTTFGRGRQAAAFAAYAGVFLCLSPVILLTEAAVYMAAAERWPAGVIPAAQVVRAAAILGILAYFRGGRLLPRTPAERTLYSLWGGYFVTCTFAGICVHLIDGWGAGTETRIYPPYALLAALAFFALGATFWGWFYVFGVAFVALALVMTQSLDVAPLEFGGLWSVVLLVFAGYLRRTSAAAKAADDPGGQKRPLVNQPGVNLK